MMRRTLAALATAALTVTMLQSPMMVGGSVLASAPNLVSPRTDPAVADTAPSASAGPEDHDMPPAKKAALEAEFQRWLATNPRSADETAIVWVPVYVWSFVNGTAGWLSEDQVRSQIWWLNHSFSGGQGGVATRFRFVLEDNKNVNVANRTATFDSDGNPTANAAHLMRMYRTGWKGTLNIWVGNLPGLNGISSWPQDQADRPSLDGIWIDREVWRDDRPPTGCRSQGDTTVHEIGHWFGLWHTDLDPYCGTQLDFMSYGSDATRQRFKTDQRTRMNWVWGHFRS